MLQFYAVFGAQADIRSHTTKAVREFLFIHIDKIIRASTMICQLEAKTRAAASALFAP